MRPDQPSGFGRRAGHFLAVYPNGYELGALPDLAHDGTRVNTQTFTACSQNVAVALYTVTGGGHTWPGGELYAAVRLIGRTTGQFNAGTTLWQLFMDHQRSAADV